MARQYTDKEHDAARKTLGAYSFKRGECVISGRKRTHGAYRSTAYGKTRDVREIAWMLAGKPLVKNRRFFSKCCDESCINIDHIVMAVK